jgi:Tol biopolymer transport system component/DNA-binding winged helix-turn-helix (wHTH) protein
MTNRAGNGEGAARYAFGDVEVDVRRMTVSVGGAPAGLEPKSFDVLRYLVENRERLVTKEDLLAAVWKDTFVTPNVLTRAVAQVRRAIGDDAQDARYIETVARRGYRFIAPVSELPADTPRAAAPPSPAIPPAGNGRRRRLLVLAAAAVLLVAGSLGAARWWRDRSRANAVVSGLAPQPSGLGPARRVTTRTGVDTMPALAPDGRSLAFVSDRSGAHEIYVLSDTPGAREVAITGDGGQNVQPAWSPDGAWLAFHSRKRRGVWVVPATGGSARQVVEFGSDPAWSPDGRHIAFTSDAGGMAAQSVIGLVAADGSGRRDLTRIGAPPGGHREPAWSRSGTTLAFTVGTGRWSQQIWMVPAAGGEPRPIAGPWIGGLDPQFAPGDRALLWGALSTAGSGFALWRQGLDPTTLAPVGAPAEVSSLGGVLEGLSIAGDGTIAYGVGEADQNLWAIDVAAGRASEPERLTLAAVRASYPDQAADGRISFLQAGPGSPSAVLVRSADGSTVEPLIDETPVGSGQWLRDGRLMLHRPRTRPPSVWIVDPATRRMTETGVAGDDIQNPRPSPDGREIAFHVIEPNGLMNVWAQRLDGGPRRRVTDDAEAASYPAWSPDGRWLAVEVKRRDQTQVAVVPREGGPIQILTADAGQSWPHSWAPDGDRIAFAGERGGIWNVYTVSRRTRAVTPLTRFDSPSGYVRYPSWSPRGDRIVFERSIRRASVWVRRPADRP